MLLATDYLRSRSTGCLREFLQPEERQKLPQIIVRTLSAEMTQKSTVGSQYSFVEKSPLFPRAPFIFTFLYQDQI